MTDRELRADARDRAGRTARQGLAVAAVFVAVTVIPTLLEVMAGHERLSEVPWGDAVDRGGYVLLVAVLMAVLAWAMRRRGR